MFSKDVPQGRSMQRKLRGNCPPLCGEWELPHSVWSENCPIVWEVKIVLIVWGVGIIPLCGVWELSNCVGSGNCPIVWEVEIVLIVWGVGRELSHCVESGYCPIVWGVGIVRIMCGVGIIPLCGSGNYPIVWGMGIIPLFGVWELSAELLLCVNMTAFVPAVTPLAQSITPLWRVSFN